MSEDVAIDSPPADAAPAEKGRGRTVLIVLAVLLLVSVVAIAALTSAGSEVDRLLGEVGDTLTPVEAMPDQRPRPRRTQNGDEYDPTVPETGTGTTGRGDEGQGL